MSTTSSVIAGQSTTAEATTTSVAGGGGGATTTLVGESVGTYEIVARESDTGGETLFIVIPPGAYTDVDIENFMLDLLESNTDMYGAEVFDDEDAALAFVVEEALRTDEQKALLDRHHFLSLIGRDGIEFRGPFSDFPGGAIGS